MITYNLNYFRHFHMLQTKAVYKYTAYAYVTSAKIDTASSSVCHISYISTGMYITACYSYAPEVAETTLLYGYVKCFLFKQSFFLEFLQVRRVSPSVNFWDYWIRHAMMTGIWPVHSSDAPYSRVCV